MMIEEIREKLIEPFPIQLHEVKPGARGQNGDCQAQIFVDVREYQNRLDEVVGVGGWSVTYRPFDQFVVICQLTILGVVREDVGETEDEEQSTDNKQPQRRRGAHPVFGGVAQAFRRAAAAFGLGRYLYSLGPTWAKFDGRKFTESTESIVAEAMSKAGLLPVTRFKNLINNANTVDQLDALKPRLKNAINVGDLIEKERQELGVLFKAKRDEFSKPVTVTTSTNERTPRSTPSPDPSNPKLTGGQMQASDFDKIEQEQKAKKEEPVFKLTPEENEFVSGDYDPCFVEYIKQIRAAKTREELNQIQYKYKHDPDIGGEFQQLEKLMFNARQRLGQKALEATGRSPAVAKAFSRMEVQGVGGVPKENPHTGQFSREQQKKQREELVSDKDAIADHVAYANQKNPTPQPTNRARAIIHKYEQCTDFDQFRDVNEEVLRLDASEKFDPTDHKYIEQAAVARHRVLQQKTDVFEQLK